MAITVTCGACGNTAQVPDKAAGLKVRCKPCGAVVPVPQAAAVGQPALVGAGVSGGSGASAAGFAEESKPAKVCTACGVDVAGRKRTKDPAGHYFCQPCWDVKVAAAAKAQPAAAGVGGETAEATDFPCAACGTLGGPDDVYDDNGRYVCKSCWDTQAAAGSLTGPVPANADRLPPVPNAGGPPPIPPEMLFCEKCGGSFPLTALQTTADGAVLCHACLLFRNNPAPPAAAYAAPVMPVAPAVHRPAAPRADYSMYKPKRSGGGGVAIAGGGGLLFVVILILRIGVRGCATYERNHRHDRDQGSTVPVQVDSPVRASAGTAYSPGR